MIRLILNYRFMQKEIHHQKELLKLKDELIHELELHIEELTVDYKAVVGSQRALNG